MLALRTQAVAQAYRGPASTSATPNVALETVVPSYSFAAGTEVARTGEENILAVVLGWYLKGLLVASAIYLGINLTRSDA